MPFRAVLVKGRGNYLCLRRLARAMRMGADLFRERETDASWNGCAAWAQTDGGRLAPGRSAGSRPAEVWSAVCAEEGNCRGARCAEAGRCFFLRARRGMQDADLLVVNHHLLFADLALRRERAALPARRTPRLVLDEAHQVENVAAEHLGLRLSQYAFEYWMRRLFVARHEQGAARGGQGRRGRPGGRAAVGRGRTALPRRPRGGAVPRRRDAVRAAAAARGVHGGPGPHGRGVPQAAARRPRARRTRTCGPSSCRRGAGARPCARRW